MERGLTRLFALIGVGILLMGASYTITNSFTNGTTADADEVNANFDAAKTAIDDNDARIDALLTTDTCDTPPCDVTAGTVLGDEFVSEPAVNTTSTTGSQRVAGASDRLWFSLVDGDADPSTKSHAVGRYREVVNFTESEGFAEWIDLVGGGQTDSVNQFLRTFCTGGAKTAGHEGCQGIRNAVRDTWLTAEGTITEAITSGTGEITVPISVGEAYSAYLGEGKLFILTDSIQSVEITSVPPGTLNDAADTITSSSSWGSSGAAFGVADGVVASDDVLNGYCFAGADSEYDDETGSPGPVATLHWLKIVDSDATADTITVEWIAQGEDVGIPYGYRAAVGADEGAIADCAEIVNPVFSGGDGDFIADSVVINKTAAWTAPDNAAFQVPAYGEPHLVGIQIFLNRVMGRNYPSRGLFISPTNDSYQHRAGVAIGSGGTTTIDEIFPFEAGFHCETGACEYAVEHTYKTDASDVGYTDSLARINFTTEDWDDDVPRAIIDVTRNASSVPGFSDGNEIYELSIDKTDGLGAGRGPGWDPFLTIRRTQTITGAKTFSGAVAVPTASADDSDTSAASTAFVQQEINGAGGTDLTCSSGVCNVDAAVTRDAELSAYTTGTSTPVDGSTACNTGDMHLETDAFKIYFCVDGATDEWYGVALSDTP